MRSFFPRFDHRRFGIALVVLCVSQLACGSAAPPPTTSKQTVSPEGSCGVAAPERERHTAPIHRTIELGGQRRFSYRVDCKRDKDCAVASVRTDCCGSYRDLGVRARERRALERRVEASDPYPASCECVAFPTGLDDGSVVEGVGEALVRCEQNECTTYSP